MDLLTKDEFFLLAIQMDLPELLNFCKSSKKINEKICKRDEIWYFKLNKEFPEWRRLNVENKTIREIYHFLYQLNSGKNKAKIEGSVYDLYEEIAIPKSFDETFEKTKFLKILEKLLNINEVVQKKMKPDVIYIIFSWIEKNLWFLKNIKFRNTIRNKIKQFKSEPEARKIIEDFGWLETYEYKE